MSYYLSMYLLVFVRMVGGAAQQAHHLAESKRTSGISKNQRYLLVGTVLDLLSRASRTGSSYPGSGTAQHANLKLYSRRYCAP